MGRVYIGRDWMNFICIGTDFRRSALEWVGQLALDADRRQVLLQRLVADESIHGAVMLATCNRTELYLSAEDVCTARRRAKVLLRELAGAGALGGENALVVRHEEEALQHLFRVTCGIESMVPGEWEILGQARRALRESEEAGAADAALRTAFRRALDLGRRVRHRTGLGRGRLSVASLMVAACAESCGRNLESVRVAVLGAGETGREAARSFAERGASIAWVLNRTVGAAEEVAASFGARSGGLDALGQALAEADIVAVATDAGRVLITADAVETALAGRGGRALVLVDLSLPRNIDERTAGLPGVRLLTIEALRAQAEENAQARRAEIESVELQIEKEVALFEAWRVSRDAESVVDDLHRQAEDIRRQVLARHGVADDEEMDRTTRALVRALFHEFGENVRALGTDTAEGERMLAAIRELFRLPVEKTKERDSA
ncbi:MAG: glutamyl-tRNA reductase [Candidatus Sumerlaeota bacterium]|nr:glutamyl-tRNA reductase [Candidatus Sumerlaeota bacterium]